MVAQVNPISTFTNDKGVIVEVNNIKPASYAQLGLISRIHVGIEPNVKATAEQWAAFRRTRGALYAYSQEHLVSHGFIQGIVGGKKLPKKITDLIQEAKPASKKAKPSKAAKASTDIAATDVKALIALLKEQGFEVVKAQENA